MALTNILILRRPRSGRLEGRTLPIPASSALNSQALSLSKHEGERTGFSTAC